MCKTLRFRFTLQQVSLARLVTWLHGGRWLGHGTMWILSVHGCGFYALWLWEHDWLRGLVWDRNGTNMLAGTLSWLSGCALWFTSLEYVRRNYFEVRAHASLGFKTWQWHSPDPEQPCELQ